MLSSEQRADLIKDVDRILIALDHNYTLPEASAAIVSIIDRLLTTSPAVTVSEDAVERVVYAMNKAQIEYWRKQPDLNHLDHEESGEIERNLLPVLARVALEAAAPPGDLDAMLNEHVSAGGTATFEREVVTWHAWVDDDRLQGSGYGPTAAVADAVARARKETTNATN